MISIIIPTRELKRSKNLKYLHKKLTSISDLINSLEKVKDSEIEVIVVINGISDQNLIDYVKNHRIISKYAIISSNSGVSRAWNIGRNLAEGELLLFLNDDVVVKEDSIKLLSDSIKDEIVMVGPMGSVWLSGKHSYFTENEDVNVISGFAFMIKSDIFDLIGGIDINFTPAGYEEVDLSFRVIKFGYQLKVIPEASFITNPVHGISAKNTQIHYFNKSINTKVLHEKNTNYFKFKWKILN
jgi:GT2 family glycosyltransferase